MHDLRDALGVIVVPAMALSLAEARNDEWNTGDEMQLLTLGLGLVLSMASGPNDIKPSLDVLASFPPQEFIQKGLQFNQAFQKHQQCMRSSYFRNGNWAMVEECNNAIGEAKDLENSWQLVEWARDADFIVDCRLDFLEELREALGEEDFWAGRLPPPAPLKYFREVD
jgi:hypothetical protein